MRVALCDPPRGEGYYHAEFPNLGLLYLASSLKSAFGGGCDVLFLDGHRGLAAHLDARKLYRLPRGLPRGGMYAMPRG
jgi:prepilin-type processing-associated H-X9-DG protein